MDSKLFYGILKDESEGGVTFYHNHLNIREVYASELTDKWLHNYDSRVIMKNTSDYLLYDMFKGKKFDNRIDLYYDEVFNKTPDETFTISVNYLKQLKYIEVIW